MHLYVLKWDINPKSEGAYNKWALEAIQRTLDIPGVREFRAYRPLAGDSQVVVTFEFATFEDWSSWFDDETVQQAFTQLFGMGKNVDRELWGPSPLIPEPIIIKDSG